MKLIINFLKLIISLIYFLHVLPYFLIVTILNILTFKYKPEWLIKLNTHFIYFTCNILLTNHSNNYLIYFILKLQKIILKFGINTGLILCRTQSIHKGQGLLLIFQAYPQPLEIYNIYFAIWFTLIQEPKFLNNDIIQIFICTIFSSGYWNVNGNSGDPTDKNFVGSYSPGLCNLISDVKTMFALKVCAYWTLHSNFTYSKDVTIIDYIKAIIPYHQKLVNARNVSAWQYPW